MLEQNPLEIDVKKSLLELAKLQSLARSFGLAVDTIRMEQAAALAEPLKMLEEANKKVSGLQSLIIASERQNVLETGEKNASGSFASRDSHLTIRRKPATFIYDEKEMMEAIKAQKGKDGTAARKRFIRVKQELNKVEINKALKAEDYEWLPAEQAGRDIEIIIEPLGDLLIIEAAMQAANAQSE